MTSCGHWALSRAPERRAISGVTTVSRSVNLRRVAVNLTDEVVLLRVWAPSDASFLADAATDPAVERYNGPMPRSDSAALKWIDGFSRGWASFEIDNDPTGTAFAIVDVASGEAVGMCGIDSWSNSLVAQFGYWLVEAARGRGLATRAVILMTDWLFELGAVRVFVTVKSENSASAAVARRAGFVYDGKLLPDDDGSLDGEDVDVFGAQRDDWRSHAS